METEDRRNKIEDRRQKGALKGSLKTSHEKTGRGLGAKKKRVTTSERRLKTEGR